MKKNFLLKLGSLLLILSLLVVGCTSGKENVSQAGEPKENQTSEASQTNETNDAASTEVIVGQTWVIDSKNPLDGANGWSLTNHGISEYVYTLQEDGSIKSRFISDLEMVDNHNFVATLNQGIKFSDGSEVNAEALAAALNKIIEQNEYSRASAGVIEYTPVEDYKMEIRTELPTVDMKSILAE